jgi:hypothetical protein
MVKPVDSASLDSLLDEAVEQLIPDAGHGLLERSGGNETCLSAEMFEAALAMASATGARIDSRHADFAPLARQTILWGRHLEATDVRRRLRAALAEQLGAMLILPSRW